MQISPASKRVADEVPKYRFDALKKTFITKGGDTTIDGKTALLRDRFELLHQQLQRDPKFQLISDEYSTPMDVASAIAITPIGALLGSTGS